MYNIFMLKEKSCGAVIYKIENNKVFYLLSKMSLGHTSLTKGHVEPGETELETAKREIFEETNLKTEIDTNFRKVITYSPKNDVIKDVIFFVAKTGEEIIPEDKHDDEVIDFYWLDFDEALQKLTFESDKDVLREANNYILKKEKIENGKL